MTEPTTQPATAARPLAERLAGLASWDTAVIALLVACLVVAEVSVENFTNTGNLRFLLLDSIALALLALPMTLIIITGEIDLSVASTLGLTSAVMGQLWVTGLPLELIVVLCVLLGALLGAVNGTFITRFGLPSLAVTIGTLAAYRGFAFVVLGNRAVADFPLGWTTTSTRALGETFIPLALLPLIVLAVVFAVVLHRTPTGRALYVIGHNDEAATFAGIDAARTRFWLFVTSGAVSGLAGVFWTLRYASARADNAQGLELAVVAAVLLGGVSIFGGRGSLAGVLAAVLLIGTIRNALQLDGVSADVLDIVTGGLLIVSVLAPNVATTLRSAAGRRARSRPETSTPGASRA